MLNECFDTGKCAPESLATLVIQQSQLVNGKRKVQMFPIGTSELVLPEGFERHENFRGVFHYDPKKISTQLIDLAGLLGRENEFLNLGPYSKADIAARAKNGEKITCVSEFTFDGTEVRCAAATEKTVKEQQDYFESTKEPNTIVLIGVLPDRVRQKVK